MVLIVGIIPASIKLSTANIKKKATFETAQVEELKAVKLKDKKENRKKEETDNEDENEMVKVLCV